MKSGIAPDATFSCAGLLNAPAEQLRVRHAVIEGDRREWFHFPKAVFRPQARALFPEFAEEPAVIEIVLDRLLDDVSASIAGGKSHNRGIDRGDFPFGAH